MLAKAICANVNHFILETSKALKQQQIARMQIFQHKSLESINSYLTLNINVNFMLDKIKQIKEKVVESEIKEEEFIEILTIIKKRIILNTQFSVEEKVAAIDKEIILEYIDMNPYFSLEEYNLVIDLEKLATEKIINDDLLKLKRQHIINELQTIEDEEIEKNISRFNEISLQDYTSDFKRKSRNIVFLERTLCDILNNSYINKIIDESYFDNGCYFDDIASEIYDDLGYIDQSFLSFGSFSLEK